MASSPKFENVKLFDEFIFWIPVFFFRTDENVRISHNSLEAILPMNCF
ncbi:hypothetical protein P872_05075 [Rhodonellum psychrophilum GCM71 = DSM 17998]|uniref:Uncharacterized protein n=1 Tax=Rhodonellum psychrophilum GCM71 = DSM 17998 TaxID=1123057 RepID=U5BYR7_9BACT|nr:hypothetical protein P872_05075 [Rhodonellum psychrophilum GCM71 = DSM 17998]